jgi:uncharacterized protein (TIGR03435 family)
MNKNVLRISLFRMVCTVCASALTLIGAVRHATAQAPPIDLSFEVATVKPVLMDAAHPFSPRHFWAHVSPAGASYWTMTLENLIAYAHNTEPFEFKGPEWTHTDHYDIEARFPEGADKKDNRKMLQTLLKDRFKLEFHIEKKELESDVLVVAKNGPKLKPSLPDPAISDTDSPLKPGESYVGDGPTKSKMTKNPDGSSTIDMGKRGTQTVKFDRETSSMHFEASKMTLGELAARLSNCLGKGIHKVEDQTGITGNYQIAFDCPMPGPRPPTGRETAGLLPTDPQDGYALIRSLDALGLKLEKRKMLQDVYFIDHVARPSDN